MSGYRFTIFLIVLMYHLSPSFIPSDIPSHILSHIPSFISSDIPSNIPCAIPLNIPSDTLEAHDDDSSAASAGNPNINNGDNARQSNDDGRSGR